MSKTIDFSKPLSEEDAAYAADRPWLAEDARLQGIDITFETGFQVDDDDETQDKTDGSEAGDANGGSEPEDGEEPEDEEEDDLEYPDWTVDQLKEELKRRELTVSGSKEQLIERLEADDSANPE